MSQKGAIIYIDDDETNRKIFQGIFGNGRFGREVVVYEEPDEVMKVLKEGDVGLLVADWNLQHATSAEICLKALALNIPLIVYSGSNPDEIFDVLPRDVTIIDKFVRVEDFRTAVKEKLG